MVCFDIFVELVPALSNCRFGFPELKSRVQDALKN